MKIGVIGKLADTENTGDLGSSNSNPPYVVTPFEGIKNYHSNNGNKVYLDKANNLNLINIYSEISKMSLEKVLNEMSGKEYSYLKTKLTEILISEITPIGKEIEKILDDKSHLEETLKKGREKANIIAEENLKNIREKVGLI